MVNVIWHQGYRDHSGDLPCPATGTVEVTASRTDCGERFWIWANKCDSETALSLAAAMKQGSFFASIFWSEVRDTAAANN